MRDPAEIPEIRDNRDRRSGIDRRYYSYSGHIPERRCEIDRRKLKDRRESALEEPGPDRRKSGN